MEPIASCSSTSSPNHSKSLSKSKLCVFCRVPIPTANSLVVYKNSSSDTYYQGYVVGNANANLISQHTFLNAMTVLSQYLNVDQKFGRRAQWSKSGNDNFVNHVCCRRCATLVQKAVELNQTILNDQTCLKDQLEYLADKIICSSSNPTREYSINACVQFREEIIKKHTIIVPKEANNQTADRSETQSTEADSQQTPKPSTSKSPSNCTPAPLIKRRTSSTHHHHRFPYPKPKPKIHFNPYVKLERLSPSTLSKSQGHQPKIPPSPPVKPTPNPKPRFSGLSEHECLNLAIHGHENPVQMPTYLLPPRPSVPAQTSPHHQFLMYYNVPFQKLPESIECLYPNCTFDFTISYNFNEQTIFAAMRRHIRCQHRSETDSPEAMQFYYCQICSIYLDNRSSYLEHRNSLHLTTPMPPVVCRFCGAILSSDSMLREHMSSHISPTEFKDLPLDYKVH